MIYIDFFGGTHGHFLDYSINALDDTVKQINPFTRVGTSHKPYKKSLAIAKHFSLYNIPVPNTAHMISIVVDFDDCLLVNLLNLTRAGDYNFNLYNFEIDFAKKISNTSWFDGFHQSLMHYGIDISQGDIVPRSVLRESLKYNFIDPDKNSLMIEIKKQKYLESSFLFPLKTFYCVDLYINKLQEIVAHFQLPYTIDQDWYCNLWHTFMSKNTVSEPVNQSVKILDAVKSCTLIDIPLLTVAQEAWLNAQLENQFHKEMPANNNQWFTNTEDILKFLKQ